MGDVNLDVAGALLNMAALSGDSQRGWGYTRAARAVLRLDRHITPLIHANTFKAVPGIGPTTDRIAREVIHDGHSAFVEGAIREASPTRGSPRSRRSASSTTGRKRGSSNGQGAPGIADPASLILLSMLGVPEREAACGLLPGGAE